MALRLVVIHIPAGTSPDREWTFHRRPEPQASRRPRPLGLHKNIRVGKENEHIAVIQNWFPSTERSQRWSRGCLLCFLQEAEVSITVRGEERESWHVNNENKQHLIIKPDSSSMLERALLSPRFGEKGSEWKYRRRILLKLFYNMFEEEVAPCNLESIGV